MARVSVSAAVSQWECIANVVAGNHKGARIVAGSKVNLMERFLVGTGFVDDARM
jgi:hypothetical protein